MLLVHCPEGINKEAIVGFWTKKTFSLFTKTSLISNRSTGENCVRSLVATFADNGAIRIADFHLFSVYLCLDNVSTTDYKDESSFLL